MIRSLTLAALILTGTVGGLAITPSAATAGPPVSFDFHDRHGGRYEVLVRHRGCWDVHATYRDRDDAVRDVRRLEWRGLDARVERVHGR